MLKNAYLRRVYDQVLARDPNAPEFHQCIREFLESLEGIVDKHPEWEQNAILERFVEPDRIITFRVTWVDDAGKVQVNRGYRVQYNSAVGPYTGGLRFHPPVHLSVMKFLGFEMNLKNGLTTLPIGGGKGGSDFDPHGKSENEIMRFCQAFITELYRHIGQFTDGPAGDIGVGSREIGYMFGQMKRITNQFDAATLTGKHLSYGGSLVRTEATGYGICYFTDEVLRHQLNSSFEGKTVIVSGSGNVATYAAEKAMQLGGKVVCMSDSNGYVHDPDGINTEEKLNFILEMRAKDPMHCKPYADHFGCEFVAGAKHWGATDVDVNMPSAMQNDVRMDSAEKIAASGVKYYIEVANMPTTNDALKFLMEQPGIIVAPSKAVNAGGVATSALEMAQNSERLVWTEEEVDKQLHQIMNTIYQMSVDAAEKYGLGYNLVAGANIAGFQRVADAMMAQGIF